MNKIMTYLCSAVVGFSFVLPFYGCSKSSDHQNQNANVTDSLANVRTTIEDFINSNETLELVIGPSATIADYAALYEVRTRLDSEIQAVQGSSAPNPATNVVFDFNIPQIPYDKNRIFIGQESVNLRLGAIRSTLNPSFLALPQDAGVDEGYEFPTGKKALVITGKEMVDVLRAGRAVANYDKTINGNRIDLDGKIIYITGPPDSIQTSVYK